MPWDEQLLGDPLMELRLAGPMNGLVNYLRDKVEVVTHGEDWVRYTVPDPLHFNDTLRLKEEIP